MDTNSFRTDRSREKSRLLRYASDLQPNTRMGRRLGQWVKTGPGRVGQPDVYTPPYHGRNECESTVEDSGRICVGPDPRVSRYYSSRDLGSRDVAKDGRRTRTRSGTGSSPGLSRDKTGY